MNKKTRGMSLAIVIVLLVPILSLGIQNIADTPSIWIVYTESPDESMTLAAQTFKNEMTSAGCIIRETTLDQVDCIPKYSDAITLIGHGHPEGLDVRDSTIPWILVQDRLEKLFPRLIIFLTCDSPSIPESRIFGFTGKIDAQAGAVLSAWKILHTLSLDSQYKVPQDAVLNAQLNMHNPLGTMVYFVHGYYGSNDDLANLREYMEPQLMQRYGIDYYRNFSYFDAFPGMNKYDVHNVEGGISSYAKNFTNDILMNAPPGTQIDIVAFSLGGLISREMIRLNRTDLASAGIEIGRVITLATPHYGTEITDYDSLPIVISGLASLFTGYIWWTPVFYSFNPQSTFINTLNSNPGSYMSGIEWYSIGGMDQNFGLLLTAAGVYEGPNDILVPTLSSIPPLCTEYQIIIGDHNQIADDGAYGESYLIVCDWLAGGIDSDGDGIINAEELHIYNTNPSLSDSDQDGLSDYHEIFTHETDPLNPDTDFDSLSDWDEINLHGTDPLNSDTDNDNLSDADELVLNTDPFDDDSDNDLILDGDEIHIYGTDPLNSDSDGDLIIDGNELVFGTDPLDSDTDDDDLSDSDELLFHGTLPTAWSTDGDILSDAQEIAWEYDPLDTDDPIEAECLTYSAWHFNGITGKVRANHYTAMDYVKVYVKYKNSMGYWTGDMHVGTDYTPLYYGDYFVEWSLLSGYVQMMVTVKAYDSANHYLGCDQAYVTLPDDGGGGRPGGDPLPE